MSSVATKEELKKAVKNKEEMIVVTGDLASSIRKDATNYEKQRSKKTVNKLSKGAAWGSFLFLPIAPIPIAILGAGILGSVLTNNDLKKYDVVIPNEGSYVKLKRKKGLF